MIYTDSVFDSFLQREVAFCLDDKVIKKGKLALVIKKDYYFIFNIYVDGILRKMEYPYPYIISNINNGLLLNYNLTSLSIGCDELYYRYLSMKKISNSKLYDKIIRFEAIDRL
jgi:hypothetical protein